MKNYDTPDLTVIILDDSITTSREWDTEEMPISESTDESNGESEFAW